MPARPALSKVEFIGLMAMLFATIAFSIDSMLPALPEIAQELSPDDLNRAQLIITSFVLGMGIGTFFTGPLSDAFGRKPVILGGAALYVLAAGWAFVAQGLEPLLVARFLQGIGAAGPRVVGLAIVRDQYAGREMARIMSFVMMVFTLVPAVAPLMGSVIIVFSGWRGVFLAFVLFAMGSALWLALRQPETLPPADRRPLRISVIRAAIAEMAAHPSVRLSILAQTFCFALLFMTITMIQQVFDLTFGRADSFPLWFAGMALVAGSASFLNASLVMKFGMRKLATTALGTQVFLSSLMALTWITGVLGDATFYAFVLWMTSVFFQTGLTIGNLNAITMEPMGHIAGMAASVSGAFSTVVAATLAVPVGQSFDGTPLPMALGVGAASLSGFLVLLHLRRIERGQTEIAS
ncbi:multidrug effflux MFS transporter [Thalassovita sp.]|uniref:multidrug effflux MFS transporter n=1 Tax=Thalassovita sp. TaxID=1979401 RepID=UPI0029DE6B11|nr:multidrug effflux MFS transporter [Thalassovita sp.]